MTSEPRAAVEVEAGYDRRTFLRTSGGVATGIAVTVLPSAAVALAAPASASATANRLGPRVEPSGDVPSDTVMAYVQDAARGEVTVVAGSSEMTFRDPVLTQRLLDAARAQSA